LNGDGEVSTNEVEAFLAQLNIKVPASQKDKILHELDRFVYKNIQFLFSSYKG
jgi:Ca2+-binding EF-hand superfamily protein